jgi:hypothetical protein
MKRKYKWVFMQIIIYGFQRKSTKIKKGEEEVST